jgi:hypothetical protein
MTGNEGQRCNGSDCAIDGDVPAPINQLHSELVYVFFLIEDVHLFGLLNG